MELRTAATESSKEGTNGRQASDIRQLVLTAERAGPVHGNGDRPEIH